MDFILNGAIEEDDEFKLVFSDDSEEEFSEEEQQLNFIDEGGEQQQEEASFYRSVDNERVKFLNQTRNPDRLSMNLRMNTMVKMICSSCTIQTTGKMLNLIRLIII